jgi:hypothetical protein
MFERFAALLESGELKSTMSTCARGPFGQEISNAKDGQRAAWLDFGSFRQPDVRSGGAGHRPAAPSRRIPLPAAESLVAQVSPSLTKDVFSTGDSNRNTNEGFAVASFHGTRSHDRDIRVESTQ